MATRTVQAIFILTFFLLTSEANAGGSASATMTVSAKVLPPGSATLDTVSSALVSTDAAIPQGPVVTPAPLPLVQSTPALPVVDEGALTPGVERWTSYRMSPGPGGEPAAYILHPARYQSLTLAPGLISASLQTNLDLCRSEQLAQAARGNARAQEQTAEVARLRDERGVYAWERVAWVLLGGSVGALAAGTVVWMAK